MPGGFLRESRRQFDRPVPGDTAKLPQVIPYLSDVCVPLQSLDIGRSFATILF